MKNRDQERLRDMLDESLRLQMALADKTRRDLDDYLIANGVCYAITLIGEAASKISDKTRLEYPQIEWRQVIGMRNFLVHDYRRVELDIVWQTATHSLSVLISQLTIILKTSDE